jgi:hypothetical protein
MNFIWKVASLITILVGLGGIFSGIFIPGLLALGAGIYGLISTAE